MIRNKRLKILHLASFQGNVGDIVNHEGFYTKFKEKITADVSFEKLEMRRFYRSSNELRFDPDFAAHANKYGLLVLGGGGFFDLKWEYSDTGTTVNISKAILDQIKIPVLVNGMGYHEYETTTEKCKAKFQEFFEDITSRNNWIVTVRNDGSLSRLKNSYGDAIVRNVVKVPDAGFFFPYGPHKRNAEKSTIIGLNLSSDLLSPGFNNDLTEEALADKAGIFINKILRENVQYKVILFAHTPQDVMLISKIFQRVEEKFLRQRISIAPYDVKDKASAITIKKYYQKCDIIIAMRFHSNVLGIQGKVPTLGLAGHQQIIDLYKELESSKYCIELSSTKAFDCLEMRMEELLKHKKEYVADATKILDMLELEEDNYYQIIKSKFF